MIRKIYPLYIENNGGQLEFKCSEKRMQPGYFSNEMLEIRVTANEMNKSFNQNNNKNRRTITMIYLKLA